MWGAPSSAGWRHSATTWSQWSGTSKPQAGACHLESPCASLTMRMPCSQEGTRGIDDMVLIAGDGEAQ